MTSHISTVLKQAITTFTCKPELFYTNLQLLSSLMDRTTAEHVNLHSQFMSEHLWNQHGKAPVTCIEIYEDRNITMGIFVLKPGGKLPLHNHPEMHGLIKVIAGKVKIISYSINTEKTKEIDQRSFQDTPLPSGRFKNKKVITAELNSLVTADSNSPTCILEPDNNNLHEIHSVDGPAAFLDVLAPPYETIPDSGSRHCSYYTKLSQVATNIFRLQEIRSPSWYWTDSSPYTGPDLFRIEDNKSC